MPQLCQPVETVSAFIVDVHIVRQVVSHSFSVPLEVFVEGSSIGRVALPPEDGEKRQLMLGRMLTEPLMNSWEISWEISGNINIFKVEAPTLKTIAVSFNHRPRWKCRNLTLGTRHSTQPCTMGLIWILLRNMWVESLRSPCRRSNLPLSRPVSGSYFYIFILYPILSVSFRFIFYMVFLICSYMFHIHILYILPYVCGDAWMLATISTELPATMKW